MLDIMVFVVAIYWNEASRLRAPARTRSLP
jgi:hypothetical protein